MTAKRRRLSRAECVNQEDREETPAQILRGAILRFFGRFDLMQIIPLTLLLTVGMLFVHSTGQQVGGHHVELFNRQCVYLAIGVALWFLFILIDYRWIGLFSTLFYFLLFVAALTSAMSLHEVATAYITEEFKLSRRKGTLIITGTVLLLGLCCSLSFGPLSGVQLMGRNIFSLFDDFSGMVLLPLGGMLISIFAGWKLDRQLYRDEISNGGDLRTPYFKALIFSLRYIAPLAIGLVFLDQQGVFAFLHK